MKLETGDIAVAVEELSGVVRMLAIQEQEYQRQPARDDYERLVARDQAERAKARRLALERVLSRLPGLPVEEPKS